MYTEFIDALQNDVKSGNLANVENTLRINDLPKEVGYALMCIAAQKDHVDIVRLLIHKGYPVNDPLRPMSPNRTPTPLHLACKNNNLELVNLLLDGGADINAIC